MWSNAGFCCSMGGLAFLTRVKILLSGCPGTGRIQPLADLLLEVVIKKTPINIGVLQPYNLRNLFLENLP